MKIQLPELLEHQAEFISDNETRYLALVGGYGAGKSVSLALKCIVLSAYNAGYAGAVLSPTYSMAMKVMVPEIQKQLRAANIPYNYSKSANAFEIIFGNKVTTVHILSAENYDRIAGLNLAFALVDEIDRMNKEVAYAGWRMLQSRLRDGKFYQLACVSTPEGFSFLYDFFEKNKDKEDRRMIKAKTRDNPFLPPEYVNSLFETYPANLIAAYLEGEFVNLASGNVYAEFNRETHKTTQSLNDFPNSVLHVGMDFNNLTRGGVNAVVSVIHNGNIIVIDEFPEMKDTITMAKAIRARYPQRPIYIYPDSAGNQERSNSSITDISILKDRQFGFEVFYHSKSPRVTDRVGAVNARIKNARDEIHFAINVEKCPHTTECLEQQAWGKDGNPDKKTGHDHMLDALGYFVYFRFPISLRGTVKQL